MTIVIRGHPRISREALLLRFALDVSGRSTCQRMKVGAVLATIDGRLSYGYNGRSHGEEHCADERDVIPAGGCGCVHAELNALLKGGDTRGAILYSSHAPCPSCARAIVNARVVRVEYVFPYRDATGLHILEKAGVQLQHREEL